MSEPTNQPGNNPRIPFSAGAPPAPPAPAPPRKSRTLRTVLIVAGGLVALCCVGGTIAAIGAGNGTPPAASASRPAAAAPAAVSSPAAVAPVAESTSAAPPAGPRTLLTLKGSGIKKTRKFTTGENWELRYTFDCSKYGGTGNFMVDDYVDGSLSDVLVNELKRKGTDSTPVYTEGEHYLEINSECAWTITVIG